MLNENAGFVCAIENKVWALESGNQLAWYRRVLADDYLGHRVHRVFRTPWGVLPNDPTEREGWKTMSYTDVLWLVEGTIAAREDTANGDVLTLLRQYAITLRRNIVPEVSNDHTDPQPDYSRGEAIGRIISARKATRAERNEYETGAF